MYGIGIMVLETTWYLDHVKLFSQANDIPNKFNNNSANLFIR